MPPQTDAVADTIEFFQLRIRQLEQLVCDGERVIEDRDHTIVRRVISKITDGMRSGRPITSGPSRRRNPRAQPARLAEGALAGARRLHSTVFYLRPARKGQA